MTNKRKPHLFPFGNDKQKGSHICSPWGMTNKGIYTREEIAIRWILPVAWARSISVK
jgi:hypothetical protein